jgi:hypothetical protein
MKGRLGPAITLALTLLAILIVPGLAACVPVQAPGPAAHATTQLTPAPVATVQPAAGTLQPGGAMVSLDIFSGRPNPVWTLSPAETIALRGLLDRLPASPCPSLPAQLGYRGFVVQFSSGSRAAGDGLRAYKGTVWRGNPWTENVANLCRSDTGREVEGALLASGRGELDTNLYGTVEAEIGAGK